MLYDAVESKFKVFKDQNGKDFQVTVMMLFLTGIAPQSEDKTNKGYFRIEIGKKWDADTLQKVWETMVFDCVTGNIPGLDDENEGLTGVRFIQKSNHNTLNSFRVEVWTKGAEEDAPIHQEIVMYLKKNILLDILGEEFPIQFKTH